jgi:hypothetical protein
MKKVFFIGIFLAIIGFSTLSSAALVDHGGGLIYDTDLNITWYAYLNSDTNTYDGYQTWVNGLQAGSVTGWRLPTTSIDGSYNVTSAGEMGHLYYTELGNSAGALTNAGPFSSYGGLTVAGYGGFYTSTPAGSGNLWYFSFNDGSQAVVSPANWYYWIHGLAVHDGNIGPSGPINTVPIPGAMLLFAPGLAGLAVLRRKFKK